MTGFFAKTTNFIWILLLAGIVLATACRKPGTSDGGGTPDPDPIPGIPDVPETTPAGTPIGTAEQIVIGPEGGTFTTANSRLTLEFPAGALSAQTTVTIQPITNNCPGATGNGYRISPHDLIFNQPVKLGFSYGDSDYVTSMPAAMTIAYQDDQQRWLAADKMVKDTTNKKVWVLTNHFSDWALFKSMELVPYSAMVEPGGLVQLGVIQLTAFKNDSLIPIPDPLQKKTSIVQEWKLAGEGQLTPNGDDAKYRAPNAIRSRNPVAVSAVLKTSGTAQFTLVSNIFIGNEGLYFRIDGGPWMYCIDHDGVFFDGYFNSIVAANLDTENPDGVSLKWVGSRYVHTFLPWKVTSWPMFLYGPDPQTTYMQILLPNGSPSPGGLYFLFGNENLDYAVGSFILQPAQRVIANPGSIPQYSRHLVEGFFKVKWKQ